MAFIRPLILGIATAIAIWLMYAGVCLGGMPRPNFNVAYLAGIGGALFSARNCSWGGVRWSLIYATIFYIPVAAMFLHLVYIFPEDWQDCRKQWQWIWFVTTVVTYAAAIVFAYLLPKVTVEDNDP